MIHMALDHTWELTGASRFAGEFFDAPLPRPENLAQFLVRFSGVAVAPAFSFLAGFSIALLVLRSREPNVVRRLIIRAAVLLLAQLVLNVALPQPILYMGVLASLAFGLAVVAVVHRLGDVALLSVAGLAIGLHPLMMELPTNALPLTAAVLFRAGTVGRVLVYYPVLPWLGVMILGYVVGRDALLRDPSPRFWLRLSGVSLAFFFAIRLAGAYGNAYPHHGIASLSFWTFAKYPPDLAFLAWSLTQIFFALWFLRSIRSRLDAAWSAAIAVFGRVAFYFYVVHFLVIGAVALVLPRLSLPWVFVVWAGVLVVLYPLCIRYARPQEGTSKRCDQVPVGLCQGMVAADPNRYFFTFGTRKRYSIVR